MKSYQIAVMEGDGIGPEIIREGIKALKTIEEISGIKFNFVNYPHGSDHYISTGEVLPDSIIRELKDVDAIYFGAIGDPRVGPSILEVGLILKIRFELDQYVNLRPVKLYPNVITPIKGIDKLDFYIVRENTEDFYNGMGAIFHNSARKTISETSLHLNRSLYDAEFIIQSSLSNHDSYGINLGLITRRGSERVMKYAFELALRKNRNKVTSVDKANVLPHIYGIWRDTFTEMARNYPSIGTEMAFVDAITMWFVKNPENFDVVVSPNLFGDIITDLGAAISGGLGFAAGANINPNGVSMFEPIHGSAPKYKGLNIANPVATILSGALLLDTIGEAELSRILEEAVSGVLSEGKVKTKDMGGNAKTSEMGDAIAKQLKKITK